MRSWSYTARACLAAAALSGTAAPARAADASYTPAQAERGAALYARDCALCHGVELRGGEAGLPLIGAAFQARWAGRSLGELFELTRRTMPVSNPGGLPPEDYAALLAYLLARNGVAPQQAPLSADPARLADVAFVPGAAADAMPAPARSPASRTIQADWRHYHGDAHATHYSPLDLIDRDNVAQLEIVWRWSAANFGPSPEFNLEVTPLMIDGVLYATAGRRRAAVAIDAVTGETLWVHRLDEGERGVKAVRINSGRGVAYWRAGDDARILYVTPGYHLVALDARSGRPVPGFGRDGVVDLKQGLGQEVDPLYPIGLTSPPTVVGDVVVVGAVFAAGGAPPTKEAVPGHVRGFDVRTGAQRWIFHTVPKPGEFGYDTWRDGSADYTGNTGVWAPMTADPELGYVYVPVEAPTGDFYGGHRHGDNLFSGSLVCLDARTGERVWHFQMVHHDIWDYDPPAAPILADLSVGGREIPAVIQVTKQALTFAFDRRTGAPVWPIEERPVPRSSIPGEIAAPTQPFPTRPAPFDRIGVGLDDLIDFTPEIAAEARRIASAYTLGPIYTPPSVHDPDGKRGTLMLPGYGGGANWQGAVFDPELQVLFVPSLTFPHLIGMGSDPALSNMRYVMTFRDLEAPFGLPIVKPPWGRITAIDMRRGEHLWMIANADTPRYVREHDKLKGVELPRTGHWDRGGLLVTRSLLFAGEGSGLYATADGGPLFRAHDKLTGEILFSYELPARQTGLPMTYAIDGRQYIVVPVGAQGHPSEFIALSVPQQAE